MFLSCWWGRTCSGPVLGWVSSCAVSGLTPTPAPVKVRSPHRLGQKHARRTAQPGGRDAARSRFPAAAGGGLVLADAESTTRMCLPRRSQITRDKLWTTIGIDQKSLSVVEPNQGGRLWSEYVIADLMRLMEFRRAPYAGPCLTISPVQCREAGGRDPAGRTPFHP